MRQENPGHNRQDHQRAQCSVLFEDNEDSSNDFHYRDQRHQPADGIKSFRDLQHVLRHIFWYRHVLEDLVQTRIDKHQPEKETEYKQNFVLHTDYFLSVGNNSSKPSIAIDNPSLKPIAI